jgi:hypothetical protein
VGSNRKTISQLCRSARATPSQVLLSIAQSAAPSPTTLAAPS